MNATNIIKFATTTLAPAGIDNTYDTISPAIKLIIAITAEHIVTLKKLLKTLTGLAIVGTALGAAFAYIKKCKEVNDLGEEDFDDLWDGEEENPEVSSCTPCRSYTTIPSDSPVPEDEKHIEESEEDASEKETPSDNSED